MPANHWAIDAMIASYNTVYQAVYGTTYDDRGPVGVSYYGAADVGAPFQIEFLAFAPDPAAVVAAARDYPARPGERHVINVFHAGPDPGDLVAAYVALGYQIRRTRPILSARLPAPLVSARIPVVEITAPEQAAQANLSLSVEGERIPPETVGSPHIRNWVAEIDGQTVGWTQLVTRQPGIGYLNQLMTLSAYRRRGAAGALLSRAHQLAWRLGCDRMVLIASDMAEGFYRRRGYRAVSYLSVFWPR
jgi:GNAT superfamily N-acetyltransferase